MSLSSTWPPCATAAMRAVRLMAYPIASAPVDSMSPVWSPMRTRTATPSGQGSVAIARCASAAAAIASNREERVTLRALLVPVMCAEGGPQQLAVALSDVSVRPRADVELEPGRPLDVAEQAGHGPDRRPEPPDVPGIAASRVVVSAGRGQRPQALGQGAKERECHRGLLGDHGLESQDASARRGLAGGDDLGDPWPAVQDGQLPKKSPGPIVAIVWPSRTTCTPPPTMMKNPVPTSPWRAMQCP